MSVSLVHGCMALLVLIAVHLAFHLLGDDIGVFVEEVVAGHGCGCVYRLD